MRISKNQVVFRVGDDLWSAIFSHKHNEAGMSFQGRSRERKVSHLTTCTLNMVGIEAKPLVGVSPCSTQDKYSWKRGIRRSLQKCLEQAGYVKLEHDTSTGKETAITMRPIYAEIMGSFYREISKKAYGPNRTHNDDGTLIVKEVPVVNRTLPENAQGTYHKGAD